MFLPILFVVLSGVSVPEQSLASHIRDVTPRRLLTEDHAEESAIDKSIRDIYSKRGLLSTSDVGDEAAYDFVFLLLAQPRNLQTEILRRLDQPGGDRGLPLDAVTLFRTRYRLDGVKAESKSKPVANPALRDTIERLYKVDQSVREAKGFDAKRLADTDRLHTKQLQAILKEHGVPTFSMIGPEAAGHFVVMIQHQSAQMRQVVLPLLRAEVDRGQADPESYALVYDLSQVDKGKNQRFGERLVCHAGKLREASIEDQEHVDQRRAEIGLMRVGLYSYLVAQTMPQMCPRPPS